MITADQIYTLQTQLKLTLEPAPLGTIQGLEAEALSTLTLSGLFYLLDSGVDLREQALSDLSESPVKTTLQSWHAFLDADGKKVSLPNFPHNIKTECNPDLFWAERFMRLCLQRAPKKFFERGFELIESLYEDRQRILASRAHYEMVLKLLVEHTEQENELSFQANMLCIYVILKMIVINPRAQSNERLQQQLAFSLDRIGQDIDGSLSICLGAILENAPDRPSKLLNIYFALCKHFSADQQGRLLDLMGKFATHVSDYDSDMLLNEIPRRHLKADFIKGILNTNWINKHRFNLPFLTYAFDLQDPTLTKTLTQRLIGPGVSPDLSLIGALLSVFYDHKLEEMARQFCAELIATHPNRISTLIVDNCIIKYKSALVPIAYFGEEAVLESLASPVPEANQPYRGMLAHCTGKKLNDVDFQQEVIWPVLEIAIRHNRLDLSHHAFHELLVLLIHLVNMRCEIEPSVIVEFKKAMVTVYARLSDEARLACVKDMLIKLELIDRNPKKWHARLDLPEDVVLDKKGKLVNLALEDIRKLLKLNNYARIRIDLGNGAYFDMILKQLLDAGGNPLKEDILAVKEALKTRPLCLTEYTASIALLLKKISELRWLNNNNDSIGVEIIRDIQLDLQPEAMAKFYADVLLSVDKRKILELHEKAFFNPCACFTVQQKLAFSEAVKHKFDWFKCEEMYEKVARLFRDDVLSTDIELLDKSNRSLLSKYLFERNGTGALIDPLTVLKLFINQPNSTSIADKASLFYAYVKIILPLCNMYGLRKDLKRYKRQFLGVLTRSEAGHTLIDLFKSADEFLPLVVKIVKQLVQSPQILDDAEWGAIFKLLEGVDRQVLWEALKTSTTTVDRVGLKTHKPGWPIHDLKIQFIPVMTQEEVFEVCIEGPRSERAESFDEVGLTVFIAQLNSLQQQGQPIAFEYMIECFITRYELTNSTMLLLTDCFLKTLNTANRVAFSDAYLSMYTRLKDRFDVNDLMLGMTLHFVSRFVSLEAIALLLKSSEDPRYLAPYFLYMSSNTTIQAVNEAIQSRFNRGFQEKLRDGIKPLINLYGTKQAFRYLMLETYHGRTLLGQIFRLNSEGRLKKNQNDKTWSQKRLEVYLSDIFKIKERTTWMGFDPKMLLKTPYDGITLHRFLETVYEADPKVSEPTQIYPELEDVQDLPDLPTDFPKLPILEDNKPQETEANSQPEATAPDNQPMLQVDPFDLVRGQISQLTIEEVWIILGQVLQVPSAHQHADIEQLWTRVCECLQTETRDIFTLFKTLENTDVLFELYAFDPSFILPISYIRAQTYTNTNGVLHAYVFETYQEVISDEIIFENICPDNFSVYALSTQISAMGRRLNLETILKKYQANGLELLNKLSNKDFDVSMPHRSTLFKMLEINLNMRLTYLGTTLTFYEWQMVLEGVTPPHFAAMSSVAEMTGTPLDMKSVLAYYESSECYPLPFLEKVYNFFDGYPLEAFDVALQFDKTRATLAMSNTGADIKFLALCLTRQNLKEVLEYFLNEVKLNWESRDIQKMFETLFRPYRAEVQAALPDVIARARVCDAEYLRKIHALNDSEIVEVDFDWENADGEPLWIVRLKANPCFDTNEIPRLEAIDLTIEDNKRKIAAYIEIILLNPRIPVYYLKHIFIQQFHRYKDALAEHPEKIEGILSTLSRHDKTQGILEGVTQAYVNVCGLLPPNRSIEPPNESLGYSLCANYPKTVCQLIPRLPVAAAVEYVVRISWTHSSIGPTYFIDKDSYAVFMRAHASEYMEPETIQKLLFGACKYTEPMTMSLAPDYYIFESEARTKSVIKLHSDLKANDKKQLAHFILTEASGVRYRIETLIESIDRRNVPVMLLWSNLFLHSGPKDIIGLIQYVIDLPKDSLKNEENFRAIAFILLHTKLDAHEDNTFWIETLLDYKGKLRDALKDILSRLTHDPKSQPNPMETSLDNTLAYALRRTVRGKTVLGFLFGKHRKDKKSDSLAKTSSMKKCEIYGEKYFKQHPIWQARHESVGKHGHKATIEASLQTALSPDNYVGAQK